MNKTKQAAPAAKNTQLYPATEVNETKTTEQNSTSQLPTSGGHLDAHAQSLRPLSARVITQPGRNAENLNSEAIMMMRNLVDFGILDVRIKDKTPKERAEIIINNLETHKALFCAAVRENAENQNPMLIEIMDKNHLTMEKIEELISKITTDTAPDILRNINMGDLRKIDQQAYYARSFYPSLNAETKAQFHQDMQWMNAKHKLVEQGFKNDLMTLENANMKRLAMFHANPSPHVDVLCIGRGNNMTRYWEYSPNKHEQSTLFVGQNNGLWEDHYQLAQTSGVLEFDPETAASNYNPNLAEAFGVSQVDAKHLYQGMIHSQVVHDFPSIPGEVVNITRHPTSGYKVQVAYNFNGENHIKTVHTNKLIVGTGLSGAKNIFYQKGQFYKEDLKPIFGNAAPEVYGLLVKGGYFKNSGASLNKEPKLADLTGLLDRQCTPNQIESLTALINDINSGRVLGSLLSKVDYERLSTFDNKRGFTPIVDGNAFILSDAECSPQGAGRTILVWGGGGTAAAAARRGLFLKDTPDIKLTPETYKQRKNDVIWIARNEFDALRDGTLALDATSTFKDAQNLWPNCELVGIKPVGNKMQLSIERYLPAPPVTDPTQIVMRRVDGVDRPCIRKMEIVEVDQLVYSHGQENRDVEQIFDGIDMSSGNMKLVIDTKLDGAPIHGTLKDNPDIEFHGAALTAGAMGRVSNDAMNKLIETENIPRDVGPGGMSLAWGLMRADHFSNSGIPYPTVNASMDLKGLIKQHLQRWGVLDEKVCDDFVNEVVAHRTEMRGGITASTLKGLIKKYDLKSKLTVDSESMLKPIGAKL
jgi:hypothetical protein